jgi:predicted transcriptional regulator
LVSSPLITIDEESSLKDAISLMMKKGIRRLPVMHGDNIIGIVNVMSVIGHIYEEKTDVSDETEGSTLNLLVKDYSHLPLLPINIQRQGRDVKTY